MSKCCSLSDETKRKSGEGKTGATPAWRRKDIVARPPLIDRLRQLTRPTMTRLGPGIYAPVEAGATPPELSLCTWRKVEENRYEPVVFSERMCRMTDHVLELLGIPRQEKTLSRLTRAGFIEMAQLAPHTWLLNLDSYYNHLRRVCEDPEFWNEGKGNIEEYRKAL